MRSDFHPSAKIQYTSAPKIRQSMLDDDKQEFGEIYLEGQYARPNRHFLYIEGQNGEIAPLLSFYERGNGNFRTEKNYVDPAYRGNKYAKALTHALMQKAHERGAVLEPSDFSHKGWQHIAPHYPSLHTLFPSLKISYDDGESIITGDRPYQLQEGYFGERAVIVDEPTPN